MEVEPIIKLINKYLVGEASTEQALLLNSWLESFNNNQSLVTSLSSGQLQRLSSKMFIRISDALDICRDSPNYRVVGNEEKRKLFEDN